MKKNAKEVKTIVVKENASAPYTGARVLVFGATGFIGRWVAGKLAGADLFLVVRRRASSADILSEYAIDGEIIETDIGPEGKAAEVIASVRPEVIFNLAGYGVDRSERDEMTARRINAGLVEEICEAASALGPTGWKGARVVHAGTALEYGTAGGDLSEDTPPAPTTLYGKTKLAGTEMLARVCERTGLRGLTARLFTVYGPGEHPGRLLPTLLESARTGSPVDLTEGLQKRDFTYVEDAATGLLRLGASEAPPGAVVNLATGRLTTVKDFTLAAARVLGLPPANLRFGAVPTRAEEMAHGEVNIERLRRLTGFVPATSVEEGVRKTEEFLKARHGEPKKIREEKTYGKRH